MNPSSGPDNDDFFSSLLSKLSVLVVEDSDYYRRLIVATLKAMGIGHSVEAESGEEAFKICNYPGTPLLTARG